MRTILLTGATGFLGSNLAQKLVASGHQVIVLKRSSSKLDRLASILPALSVYDITDLSAPFKEHGKVDAIIHTATCYGRNGESAAEIFEANVAFPLRLLETATLFDVNTFFNTDTFFNSGTIVYKYLNGYALSKNHFLEWGKLFADSQKIRFVNIRLEHMYGPGDDASKFIIHVLRQLLANVPEIKLTPGEQKRDFIYVDDVVAAYEILLEKSDSQTDLFQQYGLGSGKAVTVREFVELAHKITGSSAFLNFGALSYRENEIMSSAADTERLNSLGWLSQTDLAEGIREMASQEKTRD
ncbi:NAD-dependent epimerase/dehydratase family protein [Collimonas fungivorans]|uniref:NAD-dependent epimerase/dehydratase family protein n=1 Tax=Collimonas fungivorans TaxID=158899 RepID=UPI0007781C2D|nr:NAD-dependent epimerase/dehydratase family protein [Collimonas fungivorans]